MRKREILLTIQDRHVQDGEENASELITTGTFEGTADDYRIVYAEQDESLRDCVTTMHVEGERRVTLMRTGPSTAELILETHKRHNCHYDTPFGGFILGVYAKQITSRVMPDQACGALAFRYTLDFNSANSTENELSLFFKEVDSHAPQC